MFHLRYYGVVLFFEAFSSLISQEFEISYKPRDIREMIKQFQKNPKELIRNLNKQLNKFYLENSSQKKVQAPKEDIYEIYNSKGSGIVPYNSNSRRLYMLEARKKKVKGFLLQEASSLYLLHHAMAKNLLKLPLPKIYQSAFHFRQALRYRTLRLSPKIFISQERFKFLDKDDPQIQLANQYKTMVQDLKDTTQELKVLREKNIILDDTLYFSKDKNSIHSKIRSNNQSITVKKNILKKLKDAFVILKADYQKEADKWDQESANFLVEFSDLQRKIEDNIKNRQKKINKYSLYKGSFNQSVDYDYTQNSDFGGYVELLELAVNLDQSNPLTAFKLAKEYKSSHKNKKASFYFKRSLEFNKTTQDSLKLTNGELKEATISLGSISYQEKKFIDAAKYYEKVLELKNNKIDLLYLLGKLHYEKTGRYEKAINVLSTYLDKLRTEEKNLINIVNKGKKRKKKFLALNYMAQSFKKLRKYKLMLISFQKLRILQIKFIQDIDNQNKKVNLLFKRLEEIKKILSDQKNRENISQFYLIEKQYRESKIIFSQLNALRNALPLRNIYFNLAEYWEEQNNFAEAIMIYEEAQKYKIQPKEARRRAVALNRVMN